MSDQRLAASVAKYHDISDSESDSDATIEPPDGSDTFDASQDLFDSTSGSSAFNISRKSSSSSPGRKSSFSSSPSSSKGKHKPQMLSKSVSKTHEISDSDSDSAADTVPFTVSKSDNSSGVAGTSSSKTNSNHISGWSNNVNHNSPKNSKHMTSPKSSSNGCSGTSASIAGSSRDDSIGNSKRYSIPKLTASSSGTSRHQDIETKTARNKPSCKYGDRCFRTNPVHFQEFNHEGQQHLKRKDSPVSENDLETKEKRQKTDTGTTNPGHQGKGKSDDFQKTIADVFSEFQPLSFFLTKVRGIDRCFNNTGAVSIKDILSPLMGNLQESCQFNFMFDIPWLVEQYPKQFRNKPLLLVHGEQGRSETELRAEGEPFPHITYCRAKLEMMYGTHHTKMMFLLYDCGMRVVIHTSNLIQGDWDQKTQGVWMSPLFPRLSEGDRGSCLTAVLRDSPTHFKADLLAYIAAYNVVPLRPWERHIREHDFSEAKVYLIGSVPGRHTGEKKSAWGHMKLRKVLQEAGPDKTDMSSWPVIGQFSSIGSLGATPDQWLCDEWLSSLSQCKGTASTPLHHSKLQLVYPSKENVRLCLEGYAGGGCLPYSIKTAKKQIYLNNFVRKWGSEGRGRTGAIPHIKTYTRVSPDYTKAAWFIVTSANLSKAAWGMLEKQKTQLMIRSYEIGVLFLPSQFGSNGSFPVAQTAEQAVESSEVMFSFPYDLPPPTYQKGDRIWMWDVPCVDLPDTHGKKYCPRL